jgi:hypothetical protein
MADPAGGNGQHPPLPSGLDALEHLLLQQHVVAEVVLAGLEDRAGGAGGVAAALDLEAVEVRAVGHVIGGIELGADDVAGAELD